MLITHLLSENSDTTEVPSGYYRLDLRTPLYRGIKKKYPVGSYQIVPIRTDRLPSDSSKNASVVFNYGCYKLFGITDARKRALFCTSNIRVARGYAEDEPGDNYGSIVEVLPSNDAAFLFDPTSGDSIVITQRLFRLIVNEFSKVSQADCSKFIFMMSSCDYLSEAAESIVEQSLTTVSADVRPKFEQILDNNINYFLRHYQYHENMHTVPSNCEIMILNATSFCAYTPNPSEIK